MQLLLFKPICLIFYELHFAFNKKNLKLSNNCMNQSKTTFIMIQVFIL